MLLWMLFLKMPVSAYSPQGTSDADGSDRGGSKHIVEHLEENRHSSKHCDGGAKAKPTNLRNQLAGTLRATEKAISLVDRGASISGGVWSSGACFTDSREGAVRAVYKEEEIRKQLIKINRLRTFG